MSAITDMSLFCGPVDFGGPVPATYDDAPSWCVMAGGGVGDGKGGCNADIGSWNVSAVTDMRGMFYFAGSFNQKISAWNVSCLRSPT